MENSSSENFHREIEGLILAAGASQRAGTFKLGLPLAGRTLIECTLQGMLAVCAKIVVVTGFDHEKLQTILKRYPRVEVVINPDFQKGMFSSLKVGIGLIKAPIFFVLPADMPLVKKETYERLLSQDAEAVVPTWRGRKGHPVLLRRQLIPEIIQEPDDSNLNLFLNGRGFATLETDDEGILLDVDTIQDYHELVKRLEKGV